VPALALVTVLVRDYDEAIAWYVAALDFVVREDTPLGNKRWVVVAPRGVDAPALLLARADGPAQMARIGDQTGGRVALFLHTDDFARDHARLVAAGAHVDAPRQESYGRVAVFSDLYGNRWDLIEPNADLNAP
jgi:catechol 2,3-dioxygenase-like lactoylglutathione lyase family enzyme